MQRISNHIIGIDQGEVMMFSDFEDAGPMWSEQGPREAKKVVMFSEAYNEVPTVQVGLSMWDMDQKTNPRADVRAENITETGFELVFRTWSDTRIARVRANWMSIGELRHSDDWDLYEA